ncbi:hypothetical protein [Schlesneria sp. T3-172]|uniref:hypothetical protein n=1 Tax=Schlesneria sphaerica TaxID=3373610 RepID=UPI0037CB4947
MVNQCAGLGLLVEQMEAAGQPEAAAALKASHEKCLADHPLVEVPKSESPSLVIRTWNFGSALIRWGGAGFPTRSKREISKLLKICQSCEHLKENVCTKCGCQCNEKEQVMNKLALKTEHCPEKKW